MEKAVVLLSGGIDSSTVAAIARDYGYELYGMSFSYSQNHSVELESAKKIVGDIGFAEHRIIHLDLASFGGSSLTTSASIPKNGDHTMEIPSTYVPARNTIFLSYALAWAEVLRAYRIFIGVTAVDYSGYPDCRSDYISAYETMANLATREGVEGRKLKIEAPLITLSKAEIIRRGTELGVDYSLTHSCYDPTIEGLSCGFCDSCLHRKKGFEEAGVPDPTRYIS
ncbi:7-cyano-7-deazaguanine synthase QueC [Chitinivibrio alkaliphilus]|uniref:7-cyano-7-deazaguanine synthase n=1 Tax=Chitinivibrio alkaliphilus ACht1 TaxID=1313304 RepID=U7D4A2_9BACT|nr:7-cyano-7-deazaguanine synthase QueC [Chitinivibrio alkaliphilus]ERP30793.1 transcription regulator related protein, ExsB [Chitinivibrio alkaliphilus ACht1]